MTERRKITVELLGQLENRTDKTRWVYDADLPGFAVAVSPRGKKVFYQLGKLGEQTKRVKLGQFPAINIQEAKKKAKTAAAALAEGKNPVPSRSAKKKTLEALFKLFLELHAKPTKRTWARDESEFNENLSDWKHLPITSITRAMVVDRIAELTVRRDVSRKTPSGTSVTRSVGGPGLAAKIRALLSKLFNFAIEQGWLDDRPFNPVTATYRPKFEPRQRYLTPDEIKAFFAAMENVSRQTTKDFIWMVLWTGGRRANVASMAWKEIDFEKKVWTVPKAKYKGKREQALALGEDAIEILKRRKEEVAGWSAFVFPGGGKTGHLVDPKEAFDKVRTEAGMPDLRLHDLRRTLGAWQTAANVNLKIIQHSLGHANIQTTAQIYTPAELDAVRASINAYTAAIRSKASSGES